jgi:hypothetical protein
MPLSLEQRLKHYGLNEAATAAKTLVVTTRSIVRLSGVAGEHTTHAPQVLRTEDLAEFGSWAGVPARAVERHKDQFARRLPRRLPSDELLQLAKEKLAAAAGGSGAVGPRERDRVRKSLLPRLHAEAPQIRNVARTFLNGDGSRVKAWTLLAELLYRELELWIWAFRDVRVERGGVLEFSPGFNTLVADEITVESGGVVRSRGTLKIDCRRFGRN